MTAVRPSTRNKILHASCKCKMQLIKSTTHRLNKETKNIIHYKTNRRQTAGVIGKEPMKHAFLSSCRVRDDHVSRSGFCKIQVMQSRRNLDGSWAWKKLLQAVPKSNWRRWIKPYKFYIKQFPEWKMTIRGSILTIYNEALSNTEMTIDVWRWSESQGISKKLWHTLRQLPGIRLEGLKKSENSCLIRIQTTQLPVESNEDEIRPIIWQRRNTVWSRNK
jgi:hypothetical protein